MCLFLDSELSVQKCLYPWFQNQSPPIFNCSLFSKNFSTLQVRVNKMANEHTVHYHPSSSEITSRIHPLIFLWTPKGFTSPEYLLNFFSNMYIPRWFQELFKSMVLKLLENTFVRQKIESVHFYSCPQTKLLPRFLSSPPGRRKLPISPEQHFLKV